MFHILITLYDEPEDLGVKSNFRLCDVIAKVDDDKFNKADAVAQEIADAYSRISSPFCEQHECDGFCVDVYHDLGGELEEDGYCVSSYDVDQCGRVVYYFGNDCHE